MEQAGTWQAFAATGDIRRYLEYKRAWTEPAPVQKEGETYADRDPWAGPAGGEGGGG